MTRTARWRYGWKASPHESVWRSNRRLGLELVPRGAGDAEGPAAFDMMRSNDQKVGGTHCTPFDVPVRVFFSGDVTRPRTVACVSGDQTTPAANFVRAAATIA